MDLIGESLTGATGVFLIVALLLALAFEFVNGFHDTANAVATVIYTHALRPTYAVVWSGLWNLIGVLVSSGAVAFGVITLLPVELVAHVGTGAGFAMVFSLLVAAILWNLGTWWFGLPASSSHTLIGSILGVGLANALMTPGQSVAEGVNWAKAQEVGLGLLISPMIGFVAAAGLLLLTKALVKRADLYRAPVEGQAPPLWIRGLLLLTCTGVSFAHGSNDGQKGMGLIMLILIGILPASYAVRMDASPAEMMRLERAAAEAESTLAGHHAAIDAAEAEAELTAYLRPSGRLGERTWSALAVATGELRRQVAGHQSMRELTLAERRGLRATAFIVDETIAKLGKQKLIGPAMAAPFEGLRHELDWLTRFIPGWVKLAVALALGLGTTIGWKRIVVTVGEKIGKDHLSYAQGAAAELVAMTTIGVADIFGLPVSTTHVLSSGVAGTMAANRSGLQMNTVRNLLLAWVLTLPVCVLLGAALFAASLYVMLNVLGLR